MDKLQTPLISVVFTSYNHERFLRQAINSLLNQTFNDFELIIVDDCSTDGSQNILLEYESDKRVCLNLLKVNSGSYVKASNYGATLARGKYIMFAQCDDFAHPKQFELLINAIQFNESVGVVYSRSNMVDSNGITFEDDFRGRERTFRKRCSKDTIITGKEMRRFLSVSCVIPNLSAAILKKSLYERVGGISEKYLVAADWAFWLTLTEFTDFYYITAELNNFRQHSTTIRNTIKIKKQILEIYELMYEHIRNYNLSSSEIKKIKIGAGQVWFSYIFSGPKYWLKSFGSIFYETKKIEKNNLKYLLLGIIFYTKQLFFQRVRL